MEDEVKEKRGKIVKQFSKLRAKVKHEAQNLANGLREGCVFVGISFLPCKSHHPGKSFSVSRNVNNPNSPSDSQVQINDYVE